jgi:hypothetical protein
LDNNTWDKLSGLFDGTYDNMNMDVICPDNSIKTIFGLYVTFYAMILNIYKV